MIEEQEMETPIPQPATESVSQQLKEVVEALLFASDEPVTIQTLRVVFDDMHREAPESEQLNPTNEHLRAAVDVLNSEYEGSSRAFRIQSLAGGYVFATEKKFATWVGKLLKEKARRKLSQTAVETLAIIAYKQPITKSDVEFIRGVNADYIMKTLLEKNLATIVGRAHSPGRPLLYGTTPEFLKHFGLNELSDLPKPREIEELLGETEREVEKRMLANQQEIEFKDKLQEKLDPNSRAPHIPRKKSKLQEPDAEEGGRTVVEKAPLVMPRALPIEEPPKEDVAAAEAIVQEAPIEPAAPVNVAEEPHVEAEGVPEIMPETKDEMPAEIIAPAAARLTAEPEEIILKPVPVALHDEPEVTRPAHPEETSSKKGWGSWKTRIQTFLRKLFG